MKNTFALIKELFAGRWVGEGYAKFPTIDDTAYTEQLEFIPDAYKDVIFYQQKTWYKNNTEKNGHTVFWDVGFILLKEDKILLNSSQSVGRIESFELTTVNGRSFTFNSLSVLNDPKSIRSQRVLTASEGSFHYELNMATHEAEFQNHLKAELKRSSANQFEI